MKRTEGLLRSVLESVSDAIVTIDPRGTIRSTNPATTRLFGYSESELVGHNVRVLMPEPDRSQHDAYLERYANGGKPAIIGVGREVVARRKDDTTFPVELSVTSFKLDGAQHFTGVIRDITDRKRLEEQFRQAHKMEAFGQLAGGVAHDFNNLLTVILGETELLVSSLPQEDPAVASLTDIHEAGQRAASLTRQLLAFSRKTVLEPKVLDINVIVRETEKMLRRLIGEDITLGTRLATNLRHVNVDPGQLAQVLMNLAVNARDAMPTGGKLTIETSNVIVEETAQVLVAVSDTGQGMSPEVRARVFQPFFTTKGVGKGTGLGLAVVHGIVSQSGGRIELVTEEGVGTTFRIFLPAAPSSRPASRRGGASSEQSGSETVLLVEDDDAVRRLATRALTAKGYKVLLARDGAEALRVLGEETAVDLLVTDVVMPNMDGRQLGELMKERFPHARALYMSGYTDDMLVRRGLMSDEVDFLAKPYTPASLALAVRKVLDKDRE